MRVTDLTKLVILILATATALTWPAPLQAQNGANDEAKAEAKDLVDARAFRYYTNGLLAEGIGDQYGATQAYRKAWEFFPESYEIGYSLASTYLRLREAELALETTGKLQPVTKDVLKLQAACFRLLNRPESYRNSYLEMTFIAPDDAEAYSVLGRLYLRLNDLDSARWAIEHETRLRQGNYELLNQLGRILIGLEEPTQALAAFDKSLIIDSSGENMGGWLGKVDAYEVLSESAKAVTILQVAVELVPDNPLLLNRLVTGLTALDRFGEASSVLRRLTVVVPEDLGQVRRLGMILYYADSLDQSQAVFDDLLAADDTSDLNHHFLALIAMKQDDPQLALEEFIKASEINGETADVWMNVSFAQRNLGHIDLAVEAYLTGLSLVTNQSDSIRLLYSLGATYEELDSVDLAIEAFETVLNLDPDYHQAMNYLGYLLADRSLRLDYALKLLTKAIEMQPDNTAYLDSFGWVQYRLGNYNEAVVYLTRATELDSDPIMFDHLGDAFGASGESDQAQHWWQEALELDPDNDAIKEKLKH